MWKLFTIFPLIKHESVRYDRYDNHKERNVQPFRHNNIIIMGRNVYALEKLLGVKKSKFVMRNEEE